MPPAAPWNLLASFVLPWYHPSMSPRKDSRLPSPVQRVQTGVRMERRIVKVLKAIAEYHDISLGDLLEGICLHAFEGLSPFGEESLERIETLKSVYELDLGAADSHHLIEQA